MPEGNDDGVCLAATVTTQMGSVRAVAYGESKIALRISRNVLEFRVVLPSENAGYPTLK